MEVKIKARVSNRHVHLTKETYDKLFDEEISKRNDLVQTGEFASNEVVTIKIGDQEITNVSVLGPFREYNQIEISKRDARHMGINPPVRRSGDILDTPEVILSTPKNEIKTNGLIIANRHVHMSYEEANKYNLKDRDLVYIKIDGDKKGIIEAEVKVTPNGVLELHLDTDDTNAFLLEDFDEVTMITK